MPSPFRALFERRSGPITSSHGLYEALLRGRQSLAGVTINETTAMSVAAVATCVSLIARDIASLPWDVVERVDERTRRPAVNHPIRRVLSQPNSWQTQFDWTALNVSHVLLRGNSYNLIVSSSDTFDGSRQITELLPLHPDQVEVEQMPYPDLGLRYVWTSKDGRRWPVAQREMLHFRGLTMNGYMGRAVLDDGRDVIGVALATQQHAATFWARGGLPTVLLRHPKALSATAKDGIEAGFEKTYGGGPDQRRVAVLEEGMDVSTLSVTPEQAQYLETRKFTRGEIAGLFHVPPHLIGDTEKSTSWGTGIEQQKLGYLQFCLLPLIRSFEQRMDQALIANPNRFSTRCYMQGFMRGDAASRAQFYWLMRQMGAYSANDVRRLEDENPLEAGGDVYLQPTNLAPLGSNPLAAPSGGGQQA